MPPNEFREYGSVAKYWAGASDDDFDDDKSSSASGDQLKGTASMLAALRTVLIVSAAVGFVMGIVVAVTLAVAPGPVATAGVRSADALPAAAVSAAAAATATIPASSTAPDAATASTTPLSVAALSTAAVDLDVDISDVVCGNNEVMVLSCDVTLAVSQAALRSGALTQASLRFYPVEAPDRPAYALVDLVNAPSTGENAAGDVLIVKTLYRLRPSTQYRLELLAGSGGDETAAILASAAMRLGTTGLSGAIDAGEALSLVDGAATWEMLVFAYKVGMFHGLAAVDGDGFLVWYVNASASSVLCDPNEPCHATPNAHIESFSQIRSGPYAGAFCVNDMLPLSVYGGVELFGVDGANLQHFSGSNLPEANSSRSLELVLEGHECRGTPEGNILLTGFETQYLRNGTAAFVIDHKTVSKVDREFFIEWNPDNNVIEKNIWVNIDTPLPSVSQAIRSSGTQAANRTLDLEWSATADDDFTLMYIHISSVSVSWCGKYFVVGMRDAEGVLGLHRVSMELAWKLQSALPGSDFAFDSPDDRFYQPHDAQLFEPDPAFPDSLGTLCLVDDGGERPECAQDDTLYYEPSDDGGCYSRGLCFALDLAAGAAHKTYSFAWPNNAWANLSTHERAQDLYNLNGGSIEELDGGYLVGFTSVYKAPFSNYSWAFQTTKQGEVLSIAKLPHVTQWAGGGNSVSGLYRVAAIPSLGGESSKADEAACSMGGMGAR